MKTYWYVSESTDGWQNLAMDEWFLDHLDPEDLVLYFYINRNAVIIGKNQNPWKECDLAAMERDQVQLVRRITGGGAVYHDSGNLNFSFIAGSGRYDVQRQLNLICRQCVPSAFPASFPAATICWLTEKSFPETHSVPAAICGSIMVRCCCGRIWDGCRTICR